MLREIKGLRGLKKLEDLSVAENLLKTASLQDTGFQLVGLSDLNVAGN